LLIFSSVKERSPPAGNEGKQQGLDSSFDEFRNLCFSFIFRALKLICVALSLLHWLPLAAKDRDQGEHAVREEPVQSHDPGRQSRWYGTPSIVSVQRWSLISALLTAALFVKCVQG